jgi:hypothetical protein
MQGTAVLLPARCYAEKSSIPTAERYVFQTWASASDRTTLPHAAQHAWQVVIHRPALPFTAHTTLEVLGDRGTTKAHKVSLVWAVHC